MSSDTVETRLIHSESLRSEGEEACDQESEDGEENGREGDCNFYRLHKGTAFCTHRFGNHGFHFGKAKGPRDAGKAYVFQGLKSTDPAQIDQMWKKEAKLIEPRALKTGLLEFGSLKCQDELSKTKTIAEQFLKQFNSD